MRLLFGAHGDGLSWSVFMGSGSALLEAVPARHSGFQACARALKSQAWARHGKSRGGGHGHEPLRHLRRRGPPREGGALLLSERRLEGSASGK